MADRMYRVTAMGVMDLLRVEVDMYDLADGRTTHIASSEVYVHRPPEDDFLADVLAISTALGLIAQVDARP